MFVVTCYLEMVKQHSSQNLLFYIFCLDFFGVFFFGKFSSKSNVLVIWNFYLVFWSIDNISTIKWSVSLQTKEGALYTSGLFLDIIYIIFLLNFFIINL